MACRQRRAWPSMVRSGGAAATMTRGAWSWSRMFWGSRLRGEDYAQDLREGVQRGFLRQWKLWEEDEERLPTEEAALRWSERLRDCINSLETKYQLHAQEIAYSLDLLKYDGIICVSGDGVLTEVVNGLLENCN